MIGCDVMDEIDLKEYYQTFTDAWKLFKRHSNVTDNDAYWKTVADEVKQLTKVHNGEMAFNIMLEVVNELERIAKKKTLH